MSVNDLILDAEIEDLLYFYSFSCNYEHIYTDNYTADVKQDNVNKIEDTESDFFKQEMMDLKYKKAVEHWSSDKTTKSNSASLNVHYEKITTI